MVCFYFKRIVVKTKQAALQFGRVQLVRQLAYMLSTNFIEN